MAISYKKLWKLLIDRDINKKTLCAMAGVSPSSLAKMKKNENMNTDIILRICVALGVDVSEVMEVQSGAVAGRGSGGVGK